MQVPALSAALAPVLALWALPRKANTSGLEKKRRAADLRPRRFFLFKITFLQKHLRTAMPIW
jgi:hypothetical protein